jgi:hypothetical protein
MRGYNQALTPELQEGIEGASPFSQPDLSKIEHS